MVLFSKRNKYFQFFLGSFLIGSILFGCTRVQKQKKTVPSTKEEEFIYLSGDEFKSICKFVFENKNKPFDPFRVQHGDAIFVDKDLLCAFFAYLHPVIPHPYILVTHNGKKHLPDPIPGKYFLFLEDEKILAWFSQNVNVKHPKLISIPLGLDKDLWKNGNILYYSDALKNDWKNLPKKNLLYINFSVQKEPHYRAKLFYDFAMRSYCKVAMNLPLKDYLRNIAESKFVLCPHGAGNDTFRIWEAILLGAIPILESSESDCLYEGLPVLIVSDYRSITKEFLEKKYEEIKEKNYSKEKLEISYWKERIDEQKNCK